MSFKTFADLLAAQAAKLNRIRIMTDEASALTGIVDYPDASATECDKSYWEALTGPVSAIVDIYDVLVGQSDSDTAVLDLVSNLRVSSSKVSLGGTDTTGSITSCVDHRFLDDITVDGSCVFSDIVGIASTLKVDNVITVQGASGNARIDILDRITDATLATTYPILEHDAYACLNMERSAAEAAYAAKGTAYGHFRWIGSGDEEIMMLSRVGNLYIGDWWTTAFSEAALDYNAEVNFLAETTTLERTCTLIENAVVADTTIYDRILLHDTGDANFQSFDQVHWFDYSDSDASIFKIRHHDSSGLVELMGLSRDSVWLKGANITLAGSGANSWNFSPEAATGSDYLSSMLMYAAYGAAIRIESLKDTSANAKWVMFGSDDYTVLALGSTPMTPATPHDQEHALMHYPTQNCLRLLHDGTATWGTGITLGRGSALASIVRLEDNAAERAGVYWGANNAFWEFMKNGSLMASATGPTNLGESTNLGAHRIPVADGYADQATAEADIANVVDAVEGSLVALEWTTGKSLYLYLDGAWRFIDLGDV